MRAGKLRRWTPHDMITHKRLIRHLDQEVNRAAMAYYVYKTINTQAARSRPIYRALNESSWAWATILHSLQCTFFIYIDRVFDIKRNPHNNIIDVVETFVRYAQKHDKSRVPQFIRLRQTVASYARRAEPYRVIRKRVFAHPGYRHESEIKRLFKKTHIGQIDSLLRFLQRCVSTLTMYKLNDHDLALHKQRLTLKGNLIHDTKQMLRRLKCPTMPSSVRATARR